MDIGLFNKRTTGSNAHTPNIKKFKVGDLVRSTIDPKIAGEIQSIDSKGVVRLRGYPGTFGLSSLEKAHK